MKLFGLIFVIALAIQGSVSGPLSREKRNDEFVKDFEGAIKLYKRLVPDLESAVSVALKELPKTDAYEKYRTELQGFLDEVHKYKSVKGNCLEKIMAIISSIGEIMIEYGKDDAPVEAKEVDRLIDAQSGEEFEKKLEEFTNRLSSPAFEKGLENMNDMDSLQIAAILTEEC